MSKSANINASQLKSSAGGVKTKERTGRAHARHECDVATKFWYPKGDRYYDLKIRNLSQGGLFFESDHQLPLKTNIDIFIDEDVSDSELLKAGKHLKAIVKWSAKSHAGLPFRAGAQILSRSFSMEEFHARQLRCACDFCGRYSSYSRICIAENCIYLCQECHSQYPNLPESLKRFLMGNIY